MVSLMHPLFLRERKIRGCNEEEDVVRNILMEIRGYMRGCERVCEKKENLSMHVEPYQRKHDVVRTM